MSEENIEVVRRVDDCLARRDWDAMWRDFTPDFVLDTQLAGSYRGRNECQAFLEDQISPFESSTAEPVDVFEGGDTSRATSRFAPGPRKAAGRSRH